MKRLAALTLLLAACSKSTGDPNVEPQTATYSAGGRDRLCIRNAGDNFPAGLIVYAPAGDTNCSVSGQYRFADRRQPYIELKGDSCRIEVKGDLNGALTLGKVSPECAYYCGPGATWEGKTFQRLPNPEPAIDFAGDALC